MENLSLIAALGTNNKNDKCTPQNNMDCYFNNDWRKRNSIPKNKSIVSNFTIIQDEVDDFILNVINEAKYNDDESNNNMVSFRDSYYKRNDTSPIIKKLMSIVTKIRTVDDVADAVRILINYSIPTFFDISIVPNYTQPDIYCLSISEFPATFDPVELYKDNDPSIENNIREFIKKNYELLINWGLPSDNNIKIFTDNIIILELLLSKKNMTMEQLLDPLLTRKSVNIKKLNYCDKHKFFKRSLQFIDEDSIIITENMDYIIFLLEFINEADDKKYIKMISDYFVFCILKKYGQYTSNAKYFDIIRNYVIDPKSEYIGIFSGLFGYHLQKIYDNKFYSKEKESGIRSMFENMRNYCIDYFNNCTMFEENTKFNAIKKLKYLDIIIGSQKYYPDISILKINDVDFYCNMALIEKFYFDETIKFIGNDVDRNIISTFGEIYSFTVNAFYDPSVNMIYIPTATTNDLFYKIDADPVYNYGSLGTIIGHELMHCFDNYGSKFDHKGKLNNWWSKIDELKYNIETKKVIDHYSNLAVNQMIIDGSISVGENVADIAGIKVSLRTYIKFFCKNMKRDEIYYRIRLFFARWVSTLRSNSTIENVEAEIATDVHPPSIIRVNAPFSHISEYYDVFSVEPKHFNYLYPSQRSKFMDYDTILDQ